MHTNRNQGNKIQPKPMGKGVTRPPDTKSALKLNINPLRDDGGVKEAAAFDEHMKLGLRIEGIAVDPSPTYEKLMKTTVSTKHGVIKTIREIDVKKVAREIRTKNTFNFESFTEITKANRFFPRPSKYKEVDVSVETVLNQIDNMGYVLDLDFKAAYLQQLRNNAWDISGNAEGASFQEKKELERLKKHVDTLGVKSPLEKSIHFARTFDKKLAPNFEEAKKLLDALIISDSTSQKMKEKFTEAKQALTAKFASVKSIYDLIIDVPDIRDKPSNGSRINASEISLDDILELPDLAFSVISVGDRKGEIEFTDKEGKRTPLKDVLDNTNYSLTMSTYDNDKQIVEDRKRKVLRCSSNPLVETDRRPKAESFAIRAYSNRGDQSMNWLLRDKLSIGRHDFSRFKSMSPEHLNQKVKATLRLIQSASAALSSIAPSPFDVTRVSKLSEVDIDKYREKMRGQESLTEDAFTSTTLSEDKVLNIDSNVVFQISHHSGVFIGDMSEFDHEEEVLFKPRTQFNILAVEETAVVKGKKQYIIVMIEN